MRKVDWRRVAMPQDDGYDIQVTLDALAAGRYAEHHARAVPQDTPGIWPEGRARFVQLAHNARPSPELQDLDPQDERVRAGLALLDKWAHGRAQAAHLLVGLCPLTMGAPQISHGCTCGNFGDDWGWIYVTADNPWGFAEGIVHETAHWKLKALGIWFEDWTPELLANDPAARYDSPVRKDITRPMGAVLHAQYSYIHVAKMCVEMLKAGPSAGGGDAEWTALQLRRIAAGQVTLHEHAIGTAAGKEFLAGLDEWTTAVLDEGRAAIMAAGGGVQ